MILNLNISITSVEKTPRSATFYFPTSTKILFTVLQYSSSDNKFVSFLYLGCSKEAPILLIKKINVGRNLLQYSETNITSFF